MGGEFFTPQNVSRLLARLALSGQHEVNKIYDPACGEVTPGGGREAFATGVTGDRD